jgi:hypothetical protein
MRVGRSACAKVDRQARQCAIERIAPSAATCRRPGAAPQAFFNCVGGKGKREKGKKDQKTVGSNSSDRLKQHRGKDEKES